MAVDTKQLRNKVVLFKISGFDRVLSGTVVNDEELGMWIVSPDSITQLMKIVGGQVPQQPALFVPFASLNWMIASNA
ncbi:MAG TPA: hypothetical protein VF447_04415 [Terriglobales bacterium]